MKHELAMQIFVDGVVWLLINKPIFENFDYDLILI